MADLGNRTIEKPQGVEVVLRALPSLSRAAVIVTRLGGAVNWELIEQVGNPALVESVRTFFTAFLNKGGFSQDVIDTITSAGRSELEIIDSSIADQYNQPAPTSTEA